MRKKIIWNRIIIVEGNLPVFWWLYAWQVSPLQSFPSPGCGWSRRSPPAGVFPPGQVVTEPPGCSQSWSPCCSNNYSAGDGFRPEPAQDNKNKWIKIDFSWRRGVHWCTVSSASSSLCTVSESSRRQCTCPICAIRFPFYNNETKNDRSRMKNCKLSIIMSFQLCCNKTHRLVQIKEVKKITKTT